MTTYVARVSNDIQWDIERGFSCWGSREARKSDLDIVQEIGGYWDDEELEVRQQRWIAQFGDKYEDYDLFIEGLAREVATEDLRRDEKHGTWAIFHHDGLSCFQLSDDLDTAMRMAADGVQANGQRFDAMLGHRTVGSVEHVTTVDCDGMAVHILRCDAVEAEELLAY